VVVGRGPRTASSTAPYADGSTTASMSVNLRDETAAAKAFSNSACVSTRTPAAPQRPD
jgi:hypothetical protein